MKNKQLKIDDVLYRHVEMSGVHTYIVTEIIETKYGIQYVLQDQMCNHGWKCELLCQYDDYGNLKYVCMTNDDDDEPQQYWHAAGTHEYFFVDDKKEAYKNRFKFNIQNTEEQVLKQETSLKLLKTKLAEMKIAFKDAESVMEYLKKG